jgi:hypothetical protein
LELAAAETNLDLRILAFRNDETIEDFDEGRLFGVAVTSDPAEMKPDPRGGRFRFR